MKAVSAQWVCCCVYHKSKKYAAHGWHHSIHGWQLGWSSCSSLLLKSSIVKLLILIKNYSSLSFTSRNPDFRCHIGSNSFSSPSFSCLVNSRVWILQLDQYSSIGQRERGVHLGLLHRHVQGTFRGSTKPHKNWHRCWKSSHFDGYHWHGFALLLHDFCHVPGLWSSYH